MLVLVVAGRNMALVKVDLNRSLTVAWTPVVEDAEEVEDEGVEEEGNKQATRTTGACVRWCGRCRAD